MNTAEVRLESLAKEGGKRRVIVRNTYIMSRYYSSKNLSSPLFLLLCLLLLIDIPRMAYALKSPHLTLLLSPETSWLLAPLLSSFLMVFVVLFFKCGTSNAMGVFIMVLMSYFMLPILYLIFKTNWKYNKAKVRRIDCRDERKNKTIHSDECYGFPNTRSA